MATLLTRLPFPLLLLLLAGAGALATFSFAPWGAWWLQLPLLALLFSAVQGAGSARRAAAMGWLFSIGWQASGYWWLYVSMHRFGNLPSWMAALAVVLLAAALASYTAGAMALARWLLERGTPRTLIALGVMPAGWMLAEWVRGWLFTGFPWIVSGYAHTDGPLAGYAPLLGVYGLGFLAAVLAGCLLLHSRRALALAVLLLAGGLGLQQLQWTSPYGKPLTVRLLQGNVPQEMKFAPQQVWNALAMYREMITQEPADLVATPETALPLLVHRLPSDYLPALQQYAQSSGTHIALGVPISDGPSSYANSVLGIAPVDRPAPFYRYDKHHLVPFGEFIPPGAAWFVRMMNIPLGDFTRASMLQPPFTVKDQRIMPNVCYEDLFGEEIAAQLRHDWRNGRLPATMLLNVSNIAWFGDTIALPQHLQISRMRSLESGRPMLRSTNTGMTAVIDHRGHVVASMPSYQRGALRAQVQGMQGSTPYMAIGNLGILTLAALLLLWAGLITRRLRVSGAGKTR